MKNFITFLSLTAIGVGSLWYMIENKRKRRRLLQQHSEFNQVAKDLGGTVPGPLFKYLRSLSEEGKSTEDYELWGYSKILEFSKAISGAGVSVILGVDKRLTPELGKTVYLLYSKLSYPENLILVTYEDSGDLTYYKDIPFSVLG